MNIGVKVLDTVDEKILDAKCPLAVREECVLFFMDHTDDFDDDEEEISKAKNKKKGVSTTAVSAQKSQERI